MPAVRFGACVVFGISLCLLYTSVAAQDAPMRRRGGAVPVAPVYAEWQAPLVPQFAHSMSPVGKLVTRSADPAVVCADLTEVRLIVANQAEYERAPTMQGLYNIGYNIATYACNKKDPTGVNVDLTIYIGDRKMRHMVLPGFVNSMGGGDWKTTVDEFFDPAENKNPSGQPLNVEGLDYFVDINHIFYGRFERQRVEDAGMGRFSWLYRALITSYGNQHADLISDGVTRKTTYARSGRTYESVTMERRVVPAYEAALARNSGIFGAERFYNDMFRLLEKNDARGKAFRQFYENAFRYVMDQPSLQERP